jgi:transposase-like protein
VSAANQFKARVALEALKGVNTIQQIAKGFEIHPMQVSDWKKIMSEGATMIFAGSQKFNFPAKLSRKSLARRPGMVGSLVVSIHNEPC